MAEYHANEFTLEVWPGVVRIHQRFEEEGRQTIEITSDQVESFCDVLKRKAEEAAALRVEFENHDRVGPQVILPGMAG